MTPEEAWLAERRRHITSTDLPSVMEFSDAYGSPMDVYLDKTGSTDEGGEVPERMRWGNLLQRAILDGYAERLGVAIEHAPPHTIIEVPGHPIVSASLDARWAERDLRPVDAKNAGFRGREWGEPGTDEIPPRFYVQLQVQMAATATEIADLAVLFGGNKLEVYTVERDEGIIRGAIKAAEDFWTNHVAPRVPPAVDSSPAWTRYLARIPQRSEEVVDSDLRIDRWADALHRVQLRRAELEAFEERAKNVLRDAIRTRAGLAGPWGRASFRGSRDRAATAWKALSEELGLQLGLTPEAWNLLVERFTSAKAGPRSLRITWAEDVEVTRFDERALIEALEDLPALPPGPTQDESEASHGG